TPIRRDLSEGCSCCSAAGCARWWVHAPGAGGVHRGCRPDSDFILRTLDIPLYYYGVPAMSAMAFGVLGSVLASRTVTAERFLTRPARRTHPPRSTPQSAVLPAPPAPPRSARPRPSRRRTGAVPSATDGSVCAAP